MNIHISIPGKPIAKARPRFARRGKFVTTYSPQATEEGLSILSAREQIKGRKLTGPLCMDATFWIRRPKSHYNKSGLKKTAPEYPTGKPDLSNYVKYLEDILNECGIWDDDAQIVLIKAAKRYVLEGKDVMNPHTEADISEKWEEFR
jgi:Holliday junction resolvase RusA-like endonuclease